MNAAVATLTADTIVKIVFMFNTFCEMRAQMHSFKLVQLIDIAFSTLVGSCRRRVCNQQCTVIDESSARVWDTLLRYE
jgi:hypothetical protein